MGLHTGDWGGVNVHVLINHELIKSVIVPHNSAIASQCEECTLSTTSSDPPRWPLVQQQAHQPLRATAQPDRSERTTPPRASADSQAGAPLLQQPPKLISDDWQQLLDLQAEGNILEAPITAVAKTGVSVLVGARTGFLPFLLMDPKRVPAADEAQAEREQRLVGSNVFVKIVEVNVVDRRIVVSEKAAAAAVLAQRVQVGDILEGCVSYVSDFGAFVMLNDPAGTVSGAEGMIHISELAWRWVSTPDKVVQPGMFVRAKVVGVDREKARINLSLKQMEDDPLTETLDDLVPLDASNSIIAVPTCVPEAVEDICAALSELDAINSVTLGRQAQEKAVVSQDLELWITKEVVTDGFNLLARAGRVVQEVHVSTDMTRDEMKATIQKLKQALL